MIRRYIFLVFSLLLVISFTGCSGKKFNQNYDYGVVETRGDKNETVITFYDKNDKIVNVKKLKYGNSSDYFQNAEIDNNSLIMIPKGLFSRLDLGLLVKLDLNTGKTENYKTDIIAPVSLSFDTNNYYISNTLNFVTTLTQVNKNTKEIKTIDFKDEHITNINNYSNDNSNKTILFSSLDVNNTYLTYMYILNEQLEIEEKFDITDYGISQSKSIIVGDNIYFLNAHDKNDNLSNVIGVYNILEKSFSKITTSEKSLGDVNYHNGKLYVTHTDLVVGEGNKMSIINLKDNSIVETTLNTPGVQIEIKDNILYCFDGEAINRYKITDVNIEYISSFKIRTKNEGQFYPSSFFIKSN